MRVPRSYFTPANLEPKCILGYFCCFFASLQTGDRLGAYITQSRYVWRYISIFCIKRPLVLFFFFQVFSLTRFCLTIFAPDVARWKLARIENLAPSFHVVLIVRIILKIIGAHAAHLSQAFPCFLLSKSEALRPLPLKLGTSDLFLGSSTIVYLEGKSVGCCWKCVILPLEQIST